MRKIKSSFWRRLRQRWRWSWLGERWYRFKCWAWHRHTTVKPRWLPHTWVDKDVQLPYCMFEILGRFIEDECSPGVVDWEADEFHRQAMAELRELWRWWNEDYLKFDAWEQYMVGQETPEFVPDGDAELIPYTVAMMFRFSSPEAETAYDEASKKMVEAEVAMKAELKVRMKRLVDVKDFMWT